MLTDVKNTLSIVSQILSNDVLPYFDIHKEMTATDLSAITAQFLNLQSTLINLNQSITDEFANFPKNLLLEYVVTSNCTSIDFSNLLDLNTHKSYRIECDFINASVSAVSIYSFINGDTVLTNYYNQWGAFVATASSSSRVNYPQLVGLSASSFASVYCDLRLVNLYPRLTGVITKDLASAIQVAITSVGKSAQVSNVTRLTFTASVANSIGIGSKIRIYRGDL